MKACYSTWMPALMSSDHYLIIKTAAQKTSETNKTVQSRDNYNFINSHLQKLSAKLISGLFQRRHMYDTHTSVTIFLLCFPHSHSKYEDWYQLIAFQQSAQKGFIWVSPNTASYSKQSSGDAVALPGWCDNFQNLFPLTFLLLWTNRALSKIRNEINLQSKPALYDST